MPFIPRTIGPVITRASKQFKVVMLSGMRQVGKSTLLKNIAGGNRTSVTLDAPSVLRTAKAAPSLFWQTHSAPATIEEIQRAPALFLPLKEQIDKSPDKGQFWLTGSQKLVFMKNVADALPGRLKPFELWPYSIYEREGKGLQQKRYLPGPVHLAHSTLARKTIEETWSIIWQGAWPEVIDQDSEGRRWFYESLQETYLSKDIRDLANVGKTDEFSNFLTAAAYLSGQELRYNTLAEFSHVDTKTVKRWLSIAIASGVIILLQPYEGNIGRQLVKSPKLYFTDTGLLCYLLNINSPQELMRYPNAGSIFETFAVAEIVKSYVHNGETPDILYLRAVSGMEVDLLIHHDGKYYPVELKAKPSPDDHDARWIDKLAGVGIPVGDASIISMCSEPYALSESVTVHSIWDI